jgi:hypothetical protein
MKLNHVLHLGLCLLLLTGVTAQAADFDRDLADARTVFLQGVDGDRHAVRNATRRFKSLNRRHPQEPVLLAYLGACMTLQGRDAANNLDKRRLTEDGLRRIDQALALQADGAESDAPHYLDTLLVAANTFIHIPAFFNHHDDGKQLLQRILADDAFDGMAAGFRAATYMAAALVANGDGDSAAYRRYLDLTVSTDPDGRNGHFASSLREEL